MYGKAIKCDICQKIEYDPDHGGFFDLGFTGWIRITANRPRDYNWSFNEPKYSSVSEAVDVCSIFCARDFLSYVRDCVPADSQEQVVIGAPLNDE